MGLEFSWLFTITTLTILCFITVSVHSQCLEDQESLLLEFKNSLQFNPDSSVKLVSWTRSNDCCQWNGVTCDHFGRVVGLDLAMESIFGGLNHSSSLFGLKYLEKLNLASNSFNSILIPSSIGNLTNLRYLNLSNSGFSGELPESIGNLKELRRVDIWGCNFSGPIPDSLANLSHLVYLDFSFNNFSGQIPSFQESKNLTYIRLSYNSFTGSIPPSLFFLPSLRKLWLSYNKFGGQISGFPPSGILSNLEILDLSSNILEGPIPSYFFDFPRLERLSLSFNNFNGTVDLKSVQRLQNLTYLKLSYNNLSVDASVDISGLSSFPQLSLLGLASCNLQKFPALMNQSRIIYLDLSNNNISGMIPNWIWNVGNQSLAYNSLGHLNLSCNLFVGLQSGYKMPSLTWLDLHSNMLGGEIPLPPETAVYVDYSNNNFTSSIPVEIGNGIWVANFFSLANNSLTGPIPPSICNGSELQVLDLSNNKLSGTIPHCLIENWAETLGVLNLGNNNLSGSVSGTFPRGCVLETLDLSGNHLEGDVPESLSNCPMLEVLNLGRNNLSGNFPCFLKKSSNLRVLVLRSNDFQGGIHCPQVNINSPWPKLQIIDISLNNFSGHMPPKSFLHWNAMMIDNTKLDPNHLRYEFLKLHDFYYQDKVTVTMKGRDIELAKILTLFTAIDFSSNSFEGEIPDTIGALSSIHILNLSRNALSGQIPSNFGNLTQIESLDLSLNKLNGSIPTTLQRLTFLSVLDLAYNQLVGRIPQGNQFNTFSNTSFEGNKGLCGPPLNASCGEAELTRPTLDGGQSFTDKKEINWFYIAAMLGYTVGLGVIVGPLFYSKRWRQYYYRPLDRVIVRILHRREQRSKQQRRRNNIKKLRKSQHH